MVTMMRTAARWSRAAAFWVIAAMVLAFSTYPAAANGPTGVSAEPETGYHLTVLHTNDVHAHVAPFDKFNLGCKPDPAKAGECFGGVARRAEQIEQVRKAGGNVILVDAGDEFQGTLFYTYYKGEAAQHFMNELGYDAMAVGNHEFDDGPDTLARFIKGVRFPVLGANIDAAGEPSLAGLIKPYTVLRVGGVDLGLVGYITEDAATVSKPGPRVKIRSIEESLRAAVEALEDEGIDKIIALSHAGFGRDQELAARVDGIDVIVGGHTHTLLSNTDPAAAGPYPVVVKSPSGAPVLIVTAAAYGKYLGRLDVDFNGEGVAKAWQGGPILIDGGGAGDQKIAAEVATYEQPLAALRTEKVGEAAVDLDGDRATCRFSECTMGDLVADAMLEASAPQGAQIALENGGGLRASIPAGTVTRGQVLEVLPFGNTLAVFDLAGADLRLALEHAVSRADNPANEGTGRFLQVAGLRFTWSAAQPAGSRVVKVEIRNADGTFEPLEDQASYRVVTNDFIRNGGDGFQVLKEKAKNPYDYGLGLNEAVVAYLGKHSPVTVGGEPRIQRQD